MHAGANQLPGPRSRGGSSASLADTMFDSSPSYPHRIKSKDARRIQHRKEVYQAVKGDDGHLWGREYSLVSTKPIHDHDDLEL